MMPHQLHWKVSRESADALINTCIFAQLPVTAIEAKQLICCTFWSNHEKAKKKKKKED